MTDILPILINATIGGIIALFLKDFLSWKGQGRIEAINRYETLLIDCYGVLHGLIKKLGHNSTHILIEKELYSEIEKIFLKFSFRFPDDILERIDDLLYDSREHDRSTMELYLEEEGAPKEFLSELLLDLQRMAYKLKREIKELESYTQSIPARIKYYFKVWGFENKELLG